MFLQLVQKLSRQRILGTQTWTREVQSSVLRLLLARTLALWLCQLSVLSVTGLVQLNVNVK